MGSILSKAEIDALLHPGGSQASYENMVNLLEIAANKTAEQIELQLAENIEVEGPYVERLKGNLAQSITDDVYIAAADIGDTELFWLISVYDSTILGNELGHPPLQTGQALAVAWIDELAAVLQAQARVFEIQMLKAEALAKMPLPDQTMLVRHFLRVGEKGIEVCLLLQGADGAKLVQREERIKGGQGSARRAKSPVSDATFSPLELLEEGSGHQKLDLVEDIQLTVTVELGQVQLTLNDILELKPNSVIPLDRHVGEAVDIYINNKRSAKGEVVVLDEYFGVRILEIVAKSERLAD